MVTLPSLVRFGTVFGIGLVLLALAMRMPETAIHQSIAEELHEELDGLLQEIAIWKAYGDESHWLLELDVDEDLPFAEFLDHYRSIVKEEKLEVDDPDFEALLNGRLILLGTPAGDVSIPADQLTRLMLEETPEEYHERLEGYFAIHWDELPESSELSSSTLTAPDVIDWMEEVEEPVADSDQCLQITDRDDSMLASNITILSAESQDIFEARRVHETEPEEDYLCLVIRQPLSSGHITFGRHAPAAYNASGESSLLALAAVLLVGMAGIGELWLARRRNRKRFATINRVCEQVEQGDYLQRVPVNGSTDLDRVGEHINAMLDQTQSLTDSLRSVSANIAHDLRTPLTRLRGQIDLLAQTSNPDESMVAAVQNEADQLLDTFSALLRIAQVESGSPKSGFRDFDLAQLVSDVAELYAPAFEEKEIQFKEQIELNQALVHGDLDLWMQSLANLMDNALKYVPPRQAVSLSLGKSGSHYVIVMQDSGPGIPDLELDKVLDRFYRLPKHRGKRGNGLGLSLVAAVCRLHDAALTLSNEQGLRIAIRIPAGR